MSALPEIMAGIWFSIEGLMVAACLIHLARHGRPRKAPPPQWVIDARRDMPDGD